ncbi:MAG: pyrroline-5-carboxylate reductase [bacterium]
MTLSTDFKLAIIGSGKMGEAMASGILRAGLIKPQNLTMTDVDKVRGTKLAEELGIIFTTDNVSAVKSANAVILAVKPQYIDSVCQQIMKSLSEKCIIISIAAGIKMQRIVLALDNKNIKLVRTMPNTPCLVGAGAIAMSFSASITPEDKTFVNTLLAPLGMTAELPEDKLNAITGLSGSGPAYVAILIEALADGGVLMGLPRQIALEFAAQTVYGTAKLILDSGEHPAVVKDAVCSPGGTTIEAVAALEENGFRSAAISAVRAATNRAKELG